MKRLLEPQARVKHMLEAKGCGGVSAPLHTCTLLSLSVHGSFYRE